MGVLTSVLSCISRLALLFLFIAVCPGIPPHVDFDSYSVPPALPLEGSLTINNKLNGAERLFDGEIHGPEDLAVYNGQLYTSLHGGAVVRIAGDKLEHVAKFGQPCEGFHEEAKCGRPLGLHFDKAGKLYVADAYYGLFKVDVKTGKFDQLVSTNDTIDGKRPMLPNSVAVGNDGSVYWTDSSTSHNLQDSIFIGLASGTGRLLKYNPNTKTNTVLIDNMHFPNGLVLSKDGSFLVVCESLRYRLIKYHLKGPKTGQSEVWVDRLPGTPDNIYLTSDGMFAVPLVIARGDKDINIILAPVPLVRKFFARLMLGVQTIVSMAHEVYPVPVLKKAAHIIGHFESFPVIEKRAIVVFINELGKLSHSYHASDGLTGVSAFVEFQGHFYLGSPFNQFLARVKAN